jgi:hypothetical protein
MKKQSPLKELTLNYANKTAKAILPGTITVELEMPLDEGMRLANRWRKDEKMSKRSTWFTIHHIH